MHITSKAKNTEINSCEFVNVGIKNEGDSTKFLGTKFIKTFNDIKDWSQKWWGQILIGVIIGIVLLLIAYIF